MAYGFESNRADGSSLISSTDGVARLIYTQDIEYDFSGSIYVPNFDSDLGFFFFRTKPTKCYSTGSITNQTFINDRTGTSSWNQPFNHAVIRNELNPSASWDNTTKYLTLVAASEVTTINKFMGKPCNKILMMVHYK